MVNGPTEARFYTCSHWLTIFLVVMTTVLLIIVVLEFSFTYKYLNFNLILQFVWSPFNLLSCKQQRDREMWLKTQMKKVISMVRIRALLYLKLKVKMWSLTVQCKVIATLVIIAGTLDSNENTWLNPSLLTKLGRTHSFLSKWVISPLKKTFACGPTLREPFVRATMYLHRARKILEPGRSKKREQLIIWLIHARLWSG